LAPQLWPTISHNLNPV